MINRYGLDFIISEKGPYLLEANGVYSGRDGLMMLHQDDNLYGRYGGNFPNPQEQEFKATIKAAEGKTILLPTEKDPMFFNDYFDNPFGIDMDCYLEKKGIPYSFYSKLIADNSTIFAIDDIGDITEHSPNSVGMILNVEETKLPKEVYDLGVPVMNEPHIEEFLDHKIDTCGLLGNTPSQKYLPRWRWTEKRPSFETLEDVRNMIRADKIVVKCDVGTHGDNVASISWNDIQPAKTQLRNAYSRRYDEFEEAFPPHTPYLIQEYIPSIGWKRHDMRGEYNGCIRAIFIGDSFVNGYVRVATTPRRDPDKAVTLSKNSELNRFEDIVNFSNGAIPMPLPDNYATIIADAGKQIIHDIEDNIESIKLYKPRTERHPSAASNCIK